MENNNILRNFIFFSFILILLSCKTSKNTGNQETENDSFSYELPDWIDGNRVQMHTRFLGKYLEDPRFYKLSKVMKNKGVNVITRHFKTGGEQAYWQSSVGLKSPRLKDVNPLIANDIIKSAHIEDTYVIGYYFHVADKWAQKRHPQWVCRQSNGAPAKVNQGALLCLNSPHLDFLITRLEELVRMGIDGIYFDYLHFPNDGCWCGFCQEKFIKEERLAVPKNRKDKNWPKYKEAANRFFTENIKTIRSAIHSLNEEAVLIVSANTWPSLINYHLSENLFQHVDLLKTEYGLSYRALKKFKLEFSVPLSQLPLQKDIQISKGLIISRDATNGRPPHIWCAGFLDETNALYATASILTHGGIANMDMEEGKIPDKMLDSSFDLGTVLNPYMKKTTPFKWVGIYFPEKLKNKYLDNPKMAWDKIILPTDGVFEALMRARVPVGFITDSQMEAGKFDDYSYVFIVEEKNISPQGKRHLKKYENNGGKIISNQETWNWSTDKSKKIAFQDLLTKYPALIENAPIQLFSNSHKVQMGAFKKKNKNQIIVNCLNDFDWVERFNYLKINKLNLREKVKRTSIPPLARDNQLVLRNFSGTPKQIIDAMTGNKLAFTVENETIRIKLDDFQLMSSVVISF